MIQRFIILLRREIWEHRALIVTPAVIGGLIVLSIAIFFVTAGVIKGVGFEGLVEGITATGEHGQATGFGVLITAPVVLLNIGLFFVVFFYCLDALYAERKDRSILFWRSLPVTDTETVLSKLAIAAIVAPLLTFVVLVFTQFAILVISSIFVWMGGGSAWELVWQQVPIAKTWTLGLFTLLAAGLWSLPFVAWFLFCSAFVRKSPFLWAVIPFALIPLLERLAFRTDHFARIVYGHIGDFYEVSFRFQSRQGSRP